MTAGLLELADLSARSGVPASRLARFTEAGPLSPAGTLAAVVGMPDTPTDPEARHAIDWP